MVFSQLAKRIIIILSTTISQYRRTVFIIHTKSDTFTHGTTGFFLLVVYYIVISCSTHVIISSLVIVIAQGHFGSRSEECISILLYYNVA